MRLADFPVSILRQALRIYGEVAYGSEPMRGAPDLPTDDESSVEDVLHAFVDETPRQSGDAHRYVLRLGNSNYPFMKFVLAEHLIRGEFFLSVDTHDQMFQGPGLNSEEVGELHRRNAEVKLAIEEGWKDAGLPTAAHLKGLLESRPLQVQTSRDQHLLVVDDDRDAAETMRLLLEARGYRVDLAGDGREALECIDPERHDLVLLDLEMPGMDGLETCGHLKAAERTQGIPVLLATAGAVDLGLVEQADAFLVKPFQAEILFSFLDHLLPPRDPPASGDRPT